MAKRGRQQAKSQSREILKESSRYIVGLLADIILRNALLHASRDAFIYGDQRVTFKQYNKRVNSLIHALRDRGIKEGDVLGVLSWDCLEYADVFGAAEKGGFIIAPFNVRLSSGGIQYLINDSKTNTLFVGPELADMVNALRPKIPKVKQFISFEDTIPDMERHADLLARYPHDEPDTQVDDEDIVYLCYSSGTTGIPKGASYTNRNFREDMMCHSIEVPIRPDDKLTCLMPFFHIGGIAIRTYAYYQAVSNVIMKRFDPSTLLAAIQKEKITNVAIVPTHLVAMMEHPDFDKYDTSSIRRIYYAGSPMPRELLIRGMRAFGSVFFQAYGQTESGPDIAFLKENDHNVLGKSPQEEARLLSCGRPALGVHVRIVDESGTDVPVGDVGEIVVQSRQVMSGYWNKPAETAKTIVDGWLHTGDMGRYDEDGYIYLVDRKQDMIVSGGENIYPREVEEVLYQHPAVLECAVFGIPDPRWVEAVHAVVSLKKSTTVTPEELIEFCKKNIARYKSPKSVEIVPEIPKGSTGKIIKREMRSKYWAGR